MRSIKFDRCYLVVGDPFPPPRLRNTALDNCVFCPMRNTPMDNTHNGTAIVGRGTNHGKNNFILIL